MKLDVDDARYKELLEKEETLLALEAGGVDNWDGYDFSMEKLLAKRELTEEVQKLIDSFIEEMADRVCEDIEEPAGSGCGFGIRQDALNDVEQQVWRFLTLYDKTVKN